MDRQEERRKEREKKQEMLQQLPAEQLDLMPAWFLFVGIVFVLAVLVAWVLAFP